MNSVAKLIANICYYIHLAILMFSYWHVMLFSLQVYRILLRLRE